MKIYKDTQEAYVAHRLVIANLLGMPEADYSSLPITQQIEVNNKLLILTKQFYEAVGCPKFLLFDFATLHDANLFLASKPTSKLSQALDKHITHQINYLSGYCALQTTKEDDFLQWAQANAKNSDYQIDKILCTSFLEGCEQDGLDTELNSALILQSANNAREVFESSIGVANGLRLAVLHDRNDAEVPMHALLHNVSEDILRSIPGHADFLRQIDASEVAEIFQSSVAREASRQAKSQSWEETQKLAIEKLIKQAKKSALLQENIKSGEDVIAKVVAEQQKIVTNYNLKIESINNLAQAQNAAAQRANAAAQKSAEYQRKAELKELEARNCAANIGAMGGGMVPVHNVNFSVGFNQRTGFTMATGHQVIQGGRVVAAGSAVYNPAAAYQQNVANVVAQTQLRTIQQAEQISVKLRESLAQLQNVIANNPSLQRYQLPQTQLINPHIDRSSTLFNGFKPGATGANNYGQGAIEATLSSNRAAILAKLKNDNIKFKPEPAGSFLHKTGQSLQADTNKPGFKKLVSTTIDAAVTILTGSGKAEASPLIFSAPLNSAAATISAGTALNNAQQHGKDKNVKFKPLGQELHEINAKTAQAFSFVMSMTPTIMFGLLTTPPHLRKSEDYILPGGDNKVDAKDVQVPPLQAHEVKREDLNTGHTSAPPNLPNANVNVPQEIGNFLFMFNEVVNDKLQQDGAGQLTKGQIIEYLQNVDKIPVEQLYKDLQKIGLELYTPPQDGIYKFIHWRNDMRPLSASAKPKLENSKFIIEVHKGKGGNDYDHMHITDAKGNVYDKYLNNLTEKLRKENPSWHARKLKREVESLPEAHIKIKEFVELNMRPNLE